MQLAPTSVRSTSNGEGEDREERGPALLAVHRPVRYREAEQRTREESERVRQEVEERTREAIEQARREADARVAEATEQARREAEERVRAEAE